MAYKMQHTLVKLRSKPILVSEILRYLVGVAFSFYLSQVSLALFQNGATIFLPVFHRCFLTPWPVLIQPLGFNTTDHFLFSCIVLFLCFTIINHYY